MKLTVPNQLTILRIILTPLFVYFFVRDGFDSKLIGTAIFTLAAATDWYDGYIARKLNVITRWGQFMDRRGGFHETNSRQFRQTGCFPFEHIMCRCEIVELQEHLGATGGN